MILWTIVAGALIGWFGSYFNQFGLALGGMIGFAMGLWLRRALRDEVAREWQRLTYGQGEHPAPRSASIPVPEPAAEREAVSPLEPAVPLAAERPDQAARPAPQAEPKPQVPGLYDAVANRVLDWFTGGNTIVRIGLVVLFVGLVFLARLVANAGLYPLEARLATVGLIGAALLAVGFRKRIERPDFALHLQGGGVAVMYLTVFAAARIYEVMPPLAGFAFMILFAALGATLAVVQNSKAMALASFLGGYAVPVLLGGEAESPLGLFSYITVLNLAVLGIAWKKSWRSLNLLGFFATFGLAALWGSGAYQDRHFLICEVFLALSVAIYLATALLYAHNTPGKLGNFADSTLLFGTALAGFALQAGLVHDKPYAPAWSALAFAATYLAVAAWAFQRREQGMGLLSECLLAIGVGFVTLAIPLALGVRWTGAAWALEGAGAYWVGARQARWMPRAFGLILQQFGAILALATLQPAISHVPLANNGFVGPLLIAVPLLLTSWWLRQNWPDSGSGWARAWAPIERSLGKPWFLAGFAFAVLALWQEVTRRLPATTDLELPAPVLHSHQVVLVGLLITLALMAASDWFGRTRKWPVATWPGRVSLLLIGLGFLINLATGKSVTDWPDFAFWIAIWALHFSMLRQRDHDRPEPLRWDGAMHTLGVLVLTAMLADCLFRLIDVARLWDSSWAGVVLMTSATAMVFALTRWAGRAVQGSPHTLGWPLDQHARAYWGRAGSVLATLTFFGALGSAWFAAGDTQPLPYIPLLNPIDLAVGLAIAALAQRRLMLQGVTPQPRLAWSAGNAGLGALALLGFVAVNGIWVRTAHHYLNVPWDGTTLSSPTVLTGFSILWTLLAMGLMLYAKRKAMRLPWLTGVTLLGVVVVKLLFVDMSQAEGIARIVAFIGVGILMLLIGYFVPLPPRQGGEEKK